MLTRIDKNSIIEFLRQNIETLKTEYDVESIALFGSFALGDEREESDIDILVKFGKPTLRRWDELSSFLEREFGHRVDLVVDGRHLSDRFKKRLEKVAIYA
ncbi:MAG: nucleotidyltransferase domain-containing protein [Planctomycetes bacterium]|nr:nucleotidyltransferase domain-containing protein [Planctomycetota bacterium]